MSHYTMLYKSGEDTRDFGGRFYFYISLVFQIWKSFLMKQSLTLARYEMIIANSVPATRLIG